MFIIFNNDLFVNFWGNNDGDIFLENSCKSLRMGKNNVDLNYYYIDSIPSHCEFDQNKNLIIKKEVISQVEEISTDENGNQVINQVDVITYETERIVEPVVYYAKGLMIKPC